MLPQLPLRIGISVVCLILFWAHRQWPDMTKDPVTLALLAFALLPWLQPLFKTIELPGGFVITLQDMERKIEKAAGAAESAALKAELAVSGITSTSTQTSLIEATANAPRTSLSELAEQYERIRQTQESGPSRTSAMTAVVRQMIQQAAGVHEEDLRRLLKAETGGERLIAYASLYGNPRPALLEELVSSVTSIEKKPFAQYWGIQAIGKNLPKTASEIPATVLRALTAYEANQRRGTDRHYAVSQILAQVRGA